jgi:hypothetical protein
MKLISNYTNVEDGEYHLVFGYNKELTITKISRACNSYLCYTWVANEGFNRLYERNTDESRVVSCMTKHILKWA